MSRSCHVMSIQFMMQTLFLACKCYSRFLTGSSPGFFSVVELGYGSSPSSLLSFPTRTLILSDQKPKAMASFNLMKVKVISLSHVLLFATPRTVAYQDPPAMRYSRQEYWSGLPFPSPGDPPDPGIKPRFLHCRQTLYRLSHLNYFLKDRRQEEKGTTEDKMVGWHHRLNGYEFEQSPDVKDREAWHAEDHRGRKELDMTE